MRSGEVISAVLENGELIEFVFDANAPRGGMKHTFFTPDRKFAVQFFNDPKDARNPRIQDRIRTITGIYNPTLSEADGGAVGNTGKTAEYFRQRFCWPVAIVRQPEFGIVCPTYPKNFFFGADASTVLNLKGKDKKSNWFTGKNRKYLTPAERGDFRTILGTAISLSRSIRRMHQAGLAHSDLSCNNVLIDPRSGSAVVIDIDSLVVPNKYAPEVVGTRGYIAPEVLSSMALDFGDPNRALPCVQTDLHALPVLIYEYLFCRHPLIGPKIYSNASAEEDDFLGLGSMATFIENPNDTSNRPPDLKITISSLSKGLERLFLRAFVDGLHNPSERPTAMEWERELLRAWDKLVPCANPDCEKKWFILRDEANPVCPFCGKKAADKIILLNFKSEMPGKKGVYRDKSEIAVFDRMPIFDWHIFSNVHNDEKADPQMRAYIAYHNGMWLLVNNGAEGMMSPSGRLVPKGSAIELKDRAVFRMSAKENGLLCEVVIS
ncbi:MAG: serine/threonine protein kinase [Oscillospiraceae bacterium]|nr:serine/threonine protein kinase [Oscillospiraceae bacterium]